MTGFGTPGDQAGNEVARPEVPGNTHIKTIFELGLTGTSSDLPGLGLIPV